MPSPLEQSPFSWTWKPCSALGLSPRTSPTTFTLSPLVVNFTTPDTLFPFVGLSSATADGPPIIDAQPAAATAAAASRASGDFFMGESPLFFIYVRSGE